MTSDLVLPLTPTNTLLVASPSESNLLITAINQSIIVSNLTIIFTVAKVIAANKSVTVIQLGSSYKTTSG